MAIVGKGTGARHDAICQAPPKSGESVATVRDLCWQRPDLARDHGRLGIVPDVRSGRCSWPQRRVPAVRSCAHLGRVPPERTSGPLGASPC